MSSLKGQLSNVEGSVKSMKVAVVVGSVLTVACLAAVFGVTVLANEVSKEVKVSNGTLTSKSGQAVLTTNTRVTQKFGLGAETLGMNNASFKINAVVVNGETTTVICDDLVAVQKNSEMMSYIAEGSVLASLAEGEGDVEDSKRNLQLLSVVKFAVSEAGLHTQCAIAGGLAFAKFGMMSVSGWKQLCIDFHGAVDDFFAWGESWAMKI